jgi:hypothetical protein
LADPTKCRKVFVEASQVPWDFVLVGDYVLTWEGSISKYLRNFDPNGGTGPGPGWWENTPDSSPKAGAEACPTTPGPQRLVHTIWGYTPNSRGGFNDPSVAEIPKLFEFVISRHAGNLALSDNPNGPGPRVIPPYWTDMVAAAG